MYFSYTKKKQIYTVATLPPLNGRLRNILLPRPCWTAAAPSSPQSQCAAAYVDRVFPAPQGIHPENTGNSPGCGVVVLGGCVFFFWFPKFKKKQNLVISHPNDALHYMFQSNPSKIPYICINFLIEPLSPMSKQPWTPRRWCGFAHHFDHDEQWSHGLWSLAYLAKGKQPLAVI